MLQLLEVLLIDGVDKELDPYQSCSMNFLLEFLPPLTDKDDSADRLDHIECMLLGIGLTVYHVPFILLAL